MSEHATQVETKEPLNKSNIISFWMIILVFALPPIAAYFMYYSGMMPDGRMNKGTLVQAQQFPDIKLHTIKDNQAFTLKSNQGKWTLMLLADSSCDDLCKKNIYLMRQVKTSLGKDSHNTERLLIMKDSATSSMFNEFLKDYSKMPIVTGNTNDMKMLETFLQTIANEDTKNKVFIIDPFGKVMMHYASELQPKDLLSDLKRLILVNSNDVATNTQ